MSASLRGFAVLALLAPGLVSCQTVALGKCKAAAEYLLVEFRSGFEETVKPAEVSETPAYKVDRTTFTKVAIRKPETCSDVGATAVTGVSKSSDTIFRTQCGVWLAELERALSAAGFVVASWDAVAQLEKTGMSAYQAADKLGAAIVFVFNSLEASNVEAGSVAGNRHMFFESDEMGEEGEKLPLPDSERTYVKSIIKDRFSPPGSHRIIGLQSVLDATAIASRPTAGGAAAGESLWFYRRNVKQPIKGEDSMRFLFARAPNDKSPENVWRLAARATEAFSPSAPPPPPRLSADDVSTESTTAAVDAYAALRLDLVRDGAKDFVARFRGTK